MRAEEILWLPFEGNEENEGNEVMEVPVLKVKDVFLPGAAVTLQVTSDSRELYNEMLLSGSRYVAAALYNQQEMAAFGTLLYLEAPLKSDLI